MEEQIKNKIEKLSYLQEENTELKNIKNKLIAELNNINSLKEINNLKVEFLGKKGFITKLYLVMKNLTTEEKKLFGKQINELKTITNEIIELYIKYFKEQEINEKLENEQIDITLPATKIKTGSPHILEKVIEEIEEIFISMGYEVVDGPEIEKDLYNFEMLNVPKGHPARDAQDTFYVKDDELLLRSQTSPVQIRTMLEGKGKKPIKIVCPGKTYRRDDDDATHSHQFVQIEGLLVDKKVTLSDLKGTIEIVLKKLFGDKTEIRLRPSYYPFTEPSVEIDMSCFNCQGKGCSLCKNTGWLTVGGAGIVHPKVLEMSSYNPKEWHGFAFGFGAERIAMLKYDINDIRVFYNNDLRGRSSFDREEDLND